MIQIYKAITLSKIDYGVQGCSSASNDLLHQLQIIQNKALRIIAHAPKTTSGESLEVEVNMPLKYRR